VRHLAQTCTQLFEFVAGFNWGLHLDDGEILDATTIATLCVVLLAGNLLAGQGHLADCERIETLAADYANRASKQNKIAKNLFLGLLYRRHQGAKTATPDLGRLAGLRGSMVPPCCQRRGNAARRSSRVASLPRSRKRGVAVTGCHHR